MIYYDHLPLDKEILDALGKLSINYVFQPIFYPNGKTVFAWEALMRPTEKTVLELIDEYMQKDANWLGNEYISMDELWTICQYIVYTYMPIKIDDVLEDYGI